jgi:hypothetical protein
MNEDEIRQQVEKFYSDRAGFLIHLSIFAVVNLALWGLWLLTTFLGIGWPWPLIVTLGWGSGMAAHAIDYLWKDPRRFARLNRMSAARLEQLYGPDWAVIASEADQERIRQATFKQSNQNKEFAIHAAIYACINVMAWLLWLPLFGGGFPLPLVLNLLWGIGLVAHAANNFFDGSREVVAREQAVQRAISGYNDGYETAAGKAKRKRTQHVLTDDGELLDVVEEQDDEQQAKQRRV